MKSPSGWVLEIEKRVQEGRRVPRIAKEMAEQVAGRPFFRAGPPKHRPDAGDRAAGDDTFCDNAMVEF